METAVRKPASIRLRVDLLETLKEMAKSSNRSFNNLVESLLITAVEEDDTLMSKEDFDAKIEESIKQIERGECKRFNSALDLDKHIKGLL